MNQLTTILCVIVAILLIADLVYLNKILKILKENKKKKNVDDKYFELKYHLNLLKSTSAMLIFILGFLGFSSFKDLEHDMRSELGKSLIHQQEDITKLNETIKSYKLSLDSLNILKKQLKNLLLINESDLKKINDKVLKINNSFKYNPRVYIINNLKYPEKDRSLKLYFKDMKTIHGENLPKFNKPPFIVSQGYGAGIDILEITTTSVSLSYSVSFQDSQKGNYIFDLWIGSRE